MLKTMRNCVQVFLLDWRTDKANDNFKKINRMKKFITLMILSALCLGAKAQYQLANSDFENWEAVSQKVGWSTKKGNEPLNWNSFVTGRSEGPLYNPAVQNQLEKSEDVRPNSLGKYSVKLISKSVASVVAQGNLTTGRINMGSMDAGNANGNYNFVDDNSSDQPFTGKPDQLRVWVKYSGIKYGTATIYLLTKGYYQDPMGNTNNITATCVAKAANTELPSNAEWTQYTLSFDYSEGANETPSYAFVNFSTCNEPGNGTTDDYMLIDDIEMVYNSELTGAKYDGKDVIFENRHAIVSAIFESEKLTDLTSNGQGASIKPVYDEETALLTITVSGNNITEAPKNKHVYTIQFYNASATLAVNSAAQYGTFCAPFDVTIPAGVQAFTISGIDKNGILTLEQQNTISAHTPVIVYSESASDINAVQFGVATAGNPTSNYLTGVYTDTEAPVGSYVLQNQGGRVGFYQVQEGIQPMVRANRAYLTVPASANVKAFYMDDATAIQTVEELLSGKAEIYDLAGRRQQKLQKGINIVGGKKVLVK